MTRQQTINDASELLKNHGDARITQATLDYYRGLARGDDDKIIIATAYKGSRLVSVAACQLDGELTRHTVIATHKNYRRQGFGRAVLMALRGALSGTGIALRAGVADDNIPSKATMASAGLVIVESHEATRSRGTFTRLIYGESSQATTPAATASDGDDCDHIPF